MFSRELLEIGGPKSLCPIYIRIDIGRPFVQGPQYWRAKHRNCALTQLGFSDLAFNVGEAKT